MAEAADKDSKTEDATEKKIRDTIEQGKLPHSREAALLASFVAILVFTVFYAKDAVVDLGMFLSMFLEKPEAWPMDTETDVIALYKTVMMEIGRAVVSLLVLLVVAGIGASVLQNMPQFVGERIRPQLSRISIAKGWTQDVRYSGLGRIPEIAGQARLRQHRALLHAVAGLPPAPGRHDHQPRRFRPRHQKHHRRHIGGDRLRHGADRSCRRRLVALPLEAGSAHDQAGGQGRVQAVRGRPDHQVAAALAGA